MGSIEIIRKVDITCNGCKPWRPQIVKLGDVECIRFAVYDTALVNVVASLAGFNIDKDDRKKRPTLNKVPGFIEIKDARNKAQALELHGPAQPRRSLFGTQEDDADKPSKAKKAARTLGQLSDLRSNPELFDVKIGDTVVCLQRPIKHTDVIVARLDDQNIRPVFKIILGDGFDMETLF